MDWSCSKSNSGTLICQAAGLFFFVIPKLLHTRRIGSFTFLRCFSPPSHLPLLLHIPFVLSISIAQKSKLQRSSTYILGQGMAQREDVYDLDSHQIPGFLLLQSSSFNWVYKNLSFLLFSHTCSVFTSFFCSISLTKPPCFCSIDFGITVYVHFY